MDIVTKFKRHMKNEGRTLKWWAKTYANKITYTYFLQQLNEPARLQDWLKNKIEKYMSKQYEA